MKIRFTYATGGETEDVTGTVADSPFPANAIALDDNASDGTPTLYKIRHMRGIQILEG